MGERRNALCSALMTALNWRRRIVEDTSLGGCRNLISSCEGKLTPDWSAVAGHGAVRLVAALTMAAWQVSALVIIPVLITLVALSCLCVSVKGNWASFC
jgi:hypothetical protein